MVSPLPLYLIAGCFPIEGLHITDDNAKSHGSIAPLVANNANNNPKPPCFKRSRSYPPRRSSVDPFDMIDHQHYESDCYESEEDDEPAELLCTSRWETTPLDFATTTTKADRAPVLKRRSLSELIKTASTSQHAAAAAAASASSATSTTAMTAAAAAATSSSKNHQLPRCPRRRPDALNFLLGDQQRGDNFNELLSKALEADELAVQ